MVQLPPLLDKAYGAACLLASTVRTTPPRAVAPEDPYRPSDKLRLRPGHGSALHQGDLTLGTWNVFEVREATPILDGIEHLLVRERVDALALQEVAYDLLLEARLARYHVAFAPDVFAGIDGQGNAARMWGNAIVSPHLLTSAAVIDLPIATWRYYGARHVVRRNMIGARIAPGIDAWSAHLDLHCRPGDRATQLTVACEAADRRAARVTLLGMDANVIWAPICDELAIDVWRAHAYRDPWESESRPFPAYIDQALCRGGRPLRKAILDLPGSDHRALVATFAIGQ